MLFDADADDACGKLLVLAGVIGVDEDERLFFFGGGGGRHDARQAKCKGDGEGRVLCIH